MAKKNSKAPDYSGQQFNNTSAPVPRMPQSPFSDQENYEASRFQIGGDKFAGMYENALNQHTGDISSGGGYYANPNPQGDKARPLHFNPMNGGQWQDNDGTPWGTRPGGQQYYQNYKQDPKYIQAQNAQQGGGGGNMKGMNGMNLQDWQAASGTGPQQGGHQNWTAPQGLNSGNMPGEAGRADRQQKRGW